MPPTAGPAAMHVLGDKKPTAYNNQNTRGPTQPPPLWRPPQRYSRSIVLWAAHSSVELDHAILVHTLQPAPEPGVQPPGRILMCCCVTHCFHTTLAFCADPVHQSMLSMTQCRRKPHSVVLLLPTQWQAHHAAAQPHTAVVATEHVAHNSTLRLLIRHLVAHKL